VYGIFDGVSRITGSVGKGLAEATLDESFKERRREDSRQKPSNVVTGVASGAVTIAKGIGSGLAGVFTKPVEGAKAGGALGFFKGVGQGAVGVVTKPVVSVFDGATQGARRPAVRVRVSPRHSPAAPALRDRAAGAASQWRKASATRPPCWTRARPSGPHGWRAPLVWTASSPATTPARRRAPPVRAT